MSCNHFILEVVVLQILLELVYNLFIGGYRRYVNTYRNKSCKNNHQPSSDFASPHRSINERNGNNKMRIGKSSIQTPIYTGSNIILNKSVNIQALLSVEIPFCCF